MLVATVEDNGLGFDVASTQRGLLPRFGLVAMRERAEAVGGTLEVSSARGEGTRVRLMVSTSTDTWGSLEGDDASGGGR